MPRTKRTKAAKTTKEVESHSKKTKDLERNILEAINLLVNVDVGGISSLRKVENYLIDQKKFKKGGNRDELNKIFRRLFEEEKILPQSKYSIGGRFTLNHTNSLAIEEDNSISNAEEDASEEGHLNEDQIPSTSDANALLRPPNRQKRKRASDSGSGVGHLNENEVPPTSNTDVPSNRQKRKRTSASEINPRQRIFEENAE